MLLGTLGTSLLGNLLTGKGTIGVGEMFWCHPMLWLILKYKNYENEPIFIQEIIYLK